MAVGAEKYTDSANKCCASRDVGFRSLRTASSSFVRILRLFLSFTSS
jgi:hypothetical protein